MTKTDRLTGILLLLQERAYTAQELAERFEVSRRTIIRDAEALCELGVPLISQEGAAGGYSLPEDFNLEPLQLTRQEAFLLLVALGGLEQLGSTPFATARETLTAKVRQILPAATRTEAEQLAGVVSLNPPERERPVPFLDELIRAANERRWLEVRYRSYRGESDQIILPLSLRSSGGFWYCTAFSHTRGEERMFRVDRFVTVAAAEPPPTAEAVDRPAYDDPSHPEVVIELTPRGVMSAETEPHFGHLIAVGRDGGGTLRYRCPPSELEWLSRYVIRLAGDAVVLAPNELQDRLREMAEKIVSTYPKR